MLDSAPALAIVGLAIDDVRNATLTKRDLDFLEESGFPMA